jgi:hypothetical protein
MWFRPPLVVIGICFVFFAAAPHSIARSRPYGVTPTFLDIFPHDQMDCGKRGWLFGSVIGGRLPLTACMLKYRNNSGNSPFGPL